MTEDLQRNKIIAEVLSKLEGIDFTTEYETIDHLTYANLSMYIRDTNLSEEQIRMYYPSQIILEKGYAEGSRYNAGGLPTNCRYSILSNHMASLDEMVDDADKDGDKHNLDNTAYGCEIAICQRNSHFLVLDVYQSQGKTQILLLHLPDYELWKFFTVMDQVDAFAARLEFHKEVIKALREYFDERCLLPPGDSVSAPAILKRWKFPLGMTDDGELFDINLEVPGYFKENYSREEQIALLRHKFETSYLPQLIYTGLLAAIDAIRKKNGRFLANILETLAFDMDIDTSYTADDFVVSRIKRKACTVLRIDMPEPLTVGQCRRIYILYAKDRTDNHLEHLHYFTVETSPYAPKAERPRDYFCEWDYEGNHRIHGTIESIDEEIELAELYAMEPDFRVKFEQTFLPNRFFENPQEFMEDLRKSEGSVSMQYIELMSKTYSEVFEKENPYPADTVKTSGFTVGKYECFCISLPHPCSFMQCTRMYFAARRNGKDPLLFYVQKRLVGSDLVNVLYMRKGSVITNLNSLPNKQEERFRIVCRLEDLK